MSLRNALKTSPKLETEGVTLEIAGTRVKLARAGGANQAYNAKLTLWFKTNKRAIELDSFTETALRKQFAEFYADTIVLNWETDLNYQEGGDGTADEKWVVGIEDGEGGVKEFNRENVIAYFAEVPDWFLECKAFAEKAQHYRQSLLDGITGN